MKRSKHSLSHYRLTSLDMGQLFPVMMEEVLPGDSFRHQTSALLRVAPIVAPVMHPVHASVASFFVPARILWANWEDFITGKNTSLVLPTVTIASTDTAAIALAQAFGIGADVTSGSITVQSLPFRAYNMIWNEFYRDQDLNTALQQRNGDTGDLPADYAIRNVSWEKDYFTTCRAYPQQGANTQVVQLGIGSVPVTGLTVTQGTANAAFASASVDAAGNVIPSGTRGWGSTTLAAVDAVNSAGNAGTGGHLPNLRADFSNTPITMDINAWRQAMAMQRMREHRNRFGSRYRDMLAFLGVNSSDSRLQRPEYLGGGKQTISFSEVLATADAGTASVGDMAGHGIAALRTRPYKRFFEEHGYVLTFLSLRPVSVYTKRVPRTFLRRAYDSFWQKELEMMGEQAVTNFEVYGNASSPSATFGYIPRYDEYRHAESGVSGEFRTTLDYWHMAREFTAQPVLNGSFVSCDPTNRIYGDQTADQIYAMVAHRLSARRLVSKRARA